VPLAGSGPKTMFLSDRKSTRLNALSDRDLRDYLQFYEYFHGDNGAGLGASHQTGWTGAIARAMHLFATNTPQQVIELGKLVIATASREERTNESDHS
jgi:hypothetical protein